MRLGDLRFRDDLPSARHVPETNEHQISSHFQPAPKGHQLGTLHLLPVDRHFPDGNLQALSNVQQFHVKGPSLYVQVAERPGRKN